MEHGRTSSRPAEASALPAAPATPMAASHRHSRSMLGRLPGWWPLIAVLAVQAGLSLRLMHSDTAFQDEALYLWAGHLQWAHWLHGTPLPPFPSYFSGAPVLYPPLGALADSIGGLTGARVLSLLFMLGTTAFLWTITSRLFGQRAAFFAAGLFAVLGPTLHLGAFATFDAMSLFLVALATWCVVRAGERRDATGWMVAAGAALALANAASYSSAVFDPVVLLLAFLVACPRPGGKSAAARSLTMLIILAALLAAGLLLGGNSYLHGIEITTLDRVSGPDSALSILADSWSWTGLIALLAVGAIIVSWVRHEGWERTWLIVVLACATLLVPLEQANLHTAASLNKHGAVGAWFAAMAAGYVIDKFIAAAPAGRNRALTAGACVIALAFPLSVGVTQSLTFSTSWPNAASFIAVFRPIADRGSEPLLVEDPSIAEYYLPAGRQWKRWSSTRNIVLPSGANTGHPSKSAGVVGNGNAATFARFIAAGYFSLVALNFTDTTSLDHRIAADLRRNRHYRIIQIVPYGIEIPPIGQGTYVIWRYEQRP